MAGAVTWVMQLVDRMSAPARSAQKRLEAVEKTIQRVERLTRGSSGAFRAWAAAGESAARRVENAYKRVEGRISATSNRLRTARDLVSGAALVGAGVGYGAVRAGIAVLGGMSTREGQLGSLGTLLKGQSAAQVKQSAAWINNFADITPFEDNQVMDSVKQLLAYQFSFAQVKGISRITGDAASALGGNAAEAAQKWEIINRALGQIKSKGRLQGDELSQLEEAGISTDVYLKKYIGANYRKQMEGGQISASAAINALLKGWNEQYGGSMDKMSKTFSGMTSTLASRPQRILANMFDAGALEQPKRLLQNLVDLTNFAKPPGSQILARLSKTGKRIVDGLFGPLADKTGGQTGVDTVNRLLDKLDKYAAWWDTNGPAVLAHVKGFGEGLKSAADGVMFFLKPLGWLVDKLSALSGGSGKGGIGKVLGFGAGMAGIGWLGNLMSFGMLGKLGGVGGRVLFGALKTGAGRAAQGFLTRGILGEILTNPAGKVAGARAAWPMIQTALRGAGGFLLRMAPMAARFLPWLGRIAAGFLGLSNPVGWVVTAITLIGTGLVLAYNKFKPFHDFVDRLADGFRNAARGALDIGKGLLGSLVNLWDGLPDNVKKVLGYLIPGLNLGVSMARAATSPANSAAPISKVNSNASIAALTGVAQQLGINPNDLLAVAFKESSLNPGAVYKNKKGEVKAAGLIQFTGTTAGQYGLTLDQIRNMTPEQQAPYIAQYLREHGVKAGMNLEQIYAAVFAGNASLTGRTLYTTASGDAYTNNASLDLNKDGRITSQEAADAAASAWKSASALFAPNITINAYGSPSPQYAQDIAAAAGGAINYAREMGGSPYGGGQQ